MSDFKMRRNPERAAWAVLYGAFFTWCVLAVSLPLGARWWLRNASSDQTIIQQSSGTVIVTRPDGDAPEVNLVDIPVGSAIVTQTDSQAILTFTAAEGGEVLATVQVYGNTKLIITRADRPRYGAGVNPNHIDLQVVVGRLRAAISPDLSRPVRLTLSSKPEALTVLDVPGTHVSLEATTTESVITVREGEALVTAQNQGVTVRKEERADVAGNAPPNGPLPAERNWIVNGDFQQPLEEGWTTDIRRPNITGEDWGKAVIVTKDERPAVNLVRAGTDWGQAGITQEISRDVRDYKSLRLHMLMLIRLQDLWNCGALGSECPIIVTVRYIDTAGVEREWLQGFFYNYNPNTAFGKTFCSSCAGAAVSREHQRVTANEWTTFDSDNLLEIFETAGQPAATIKSITLYGSGHIFDSEVTEVELLAQE